MPNPPSERRLHPFSFVFEIAAHGRELLLPGLFVLIAGARGSDSWQLWIMVLFVPYALAAALRTFVFRYLLGAEELVIRSGLIFRQQRHVPYARIQNIDAVQTVLHRALNVVQVRLETGGGEEPEAKLNVVSREAFEELRRVVIGGRGQTEAPADVAAAPPLLQLSTRELIVCGLVQGRGLLVVGALLGLVWELGLMDRMTTAVFGGEASGRGVVRQLVAAIFGQGRAGIGTIARAMAAFATLLVVTRVFSVAWVLVRLNGFTLRRDGDDLRAEFGLLTRVTASIPIRRIQTVTIHEGPLHRWFDRVSVHVDTAGGEKDAAVKLQREWLAPILPRADVPRLLRDVLPAVDVAAVEWQPVEARGVGRLRVSGLVPAILATAPLVMLLRWWTPAVFAALVCLGEVNARKSVRALGWSLSETAVFFRSGWLFRRQTVAAVSKIQAVVVRESPFDRRHRMASVAVDTAGGAADEHRIAVPFLSRQIASRLGADLAAHAARTAFKW